MSFHNAQTPDDIPGEMGKPAPVIYTVARQYGDGARDFFLCASCGLKDKEAERMGDNEAAFAMEMGFAEICADCEDEL